MKILILTIFLNLIAFVISFGQSAECIRANFDKPFYVSGETIWFKIYIRSDSTISSRVLYVTLTNHEDQHIATQKLLIEKGASSGNLILPADTKEGYYQFSVYTRYNLNFDSDAVFQKIIPIYQPDKTDFVYDEFALGGLQKIRSKQEIVVQIGSERYKPRDAVSVGIQIDNSFLAGLEGNFSISVIPINMLNQLYNDEDLEMKCSIGETIGKPAIKPEQKLTLEGMLLDPQSGERITSGVISIYMDEYARFIRASAQDGKIQAQIPDYWGKGILQIMNLDPYQSSVVKFVPEGNGLLTPYYNTNKPIRSEDVMVYLDLVRKRRKIVELFDLYTLPSQRDIQVQERKPDAVYKTDAYQYISSFEEFINEAIVNTKVRTVKGEKTIRLFNRETAKRFMDHPWYIVDGYLTYNEQEVLQTQYQDILEVRLYTRTSTIKSYFEPFMWRNGIMEIKTRDVKYDRKLRSNSNVVEMEGFAYPESFESSYSQPENENIPDLRGTMYWLPNVVTDEEGRAQVVFPLSDDTGEYAIVVKGRAGDGDIIGGYATLEIKEP